MVAILLRSVVVVIVGLGILALQVSNPSGLDWRRKVACAWRRFLIYTVLLTAVSACVGWTAYQLRAGSSSDYEIIAYVLVSLGSVRGESIPAASKNVTIATVLAAMIVSLMPLRIVAKRFIRELELDLVAAEKAM